MSARFKSRWRVTLDFRTLSDRDAWHAYEKALQVLRGDVVVIEATLDPVVEEYVDVPLPGFDEAEP